jgi:TfoX/Sxy family transcriptional regulator of competence genes
VEAEEIVASVRAALARVKAVREVKMFGGVGFMLNGNMVVAASKRGLLARVGKAAHAEALSRPGARAMEMRGRVMEGYVFVDPVGLTAASIAGWLELARAFVETLPAKSAAAPKKRKGK